MPGLGGGAFTITVEEKRRGGSRKIPVLARTLHPAYSVLGLIDCNFSSKCGLRVLQLSLTCADEVSGSDKN